MTPMFQGVQDAKANRCDHCILHSRTPCQQLCTWRYARLRDTWLHGARKSNRAPSLTSDPRLIGTAPVPPHHQPTSADVASLPNDILKLDPEDAAVDRAIGNICRGC